jgi:hypothetical protein
MTTSLIDGDNLYEMNVAIADADQRSATDYERANLRF